MLKRNAIKKFSIKQRALKRWSREVKIYSTHKLMGRHSRRLFSFVPKKNSSRECYTLTVDKNRTRIIGQFQCTKRAFNLEALLVLNYGSLAYIRNGMDDCKYLTLHRYERCKVITSFVTAHAWHPQGGEEWGRMLVAWKNRCMHGM